MFRIQLSRVGSRTMSSRSRGRVVARAKIPDGNCDRQEHYGDHWHKWSVFGIHSATEQPYAGIERCEAERDNPAKEKLHNSAVDRKRVTPECDYVPHGRMNANAVLKPERNGAQKQKNRNVNNRRAGAEENQQPEFGGRPHHSEAPGSPPHAENASRHFLERLDAKRLK